ncbi:MAG: hypothetical protein BEN19_04495 [Epulopiscium sp. Nuni2H_MBin003]|nr:MAG: hypothetical protein BEN19_04495 [Epulopiscium sp. Nuni2H_MBin003]
MILVIDVGTSSMRSVIFDDNGMSLVTIKRAYDIEVIDKEKIEQDSDIVIDSVLSTLPEIGKWLKETNNKLDAISVTAQRASVIPVNKNCIPLRKAIMWQDTRANYVSERLKDKWQDLYQVSGLKPSPIFPIPKIIYLKEEESFIYDKAYKILGFHERVLYALTNRFVTDTSIASRWGLFDITKKEWSDELFDLCDIDINKFCDVVPVGSIVAETTEEICSLLDIEKSVPVITAGGDQQCATLGLGCVDNADVVSNCGTGAYVISISDKPIFDKDMRINCNISAMPDKWIIEGTVLGSGKVIDWTMREFFGGDIDEFQQACDNTPVGSNNVLFSPTFMGSGTPDWNAAAKGSIYNISLSNTKSDFARATLEGIAYEVNGCVNIISELMDADVESVNISGGLTNNRVYNQILCDMFDKPVVRVDDAESTALGAFVSAKVTLNQNLDYASVIKQYLREMNRKIYLPIKENHNLYKEFSNKRIQQSKIYNY